MEINLNKDIGMRFDPSGSNVEGVDHKTANASRESNRTPNLTVGNGVSGLADAEPTAEVPESALRRDDELGNLVNSAFNLAPPPMPSFDN